ncbi:uncharacterized protein LOC111872486 isoform X2 [Cryptotermes secundus]|nr:uncharacterized protein LOC111872486 isoform X2 [Cryptotermes secundus]
MQLLGVLCCFCLVVPYRATENESSSQGSGVIITSEHGFKPEQRSEEGGYVGNEIVPLGPMVQLLVKAARNGSEQSTSRTGASELPRLTGESVVGNDQPDDGDPRLKRSPHKHGKGCFSCGYGGGGGGGYYVEPVYVKPIRIQPVYVKTVEYVQPVYQKPVYSHPHYSSGCSSCGGGGGGSGSYSYSQSSAASSSYSYGYGKK